MSFESLPKLSSRSPEELTQILYNKIPKWLLAAMAAMGQESKAIEDLTELTAQAYAEGYKSGVNETMNKIREMLIKAKLEGKVSQA